LIQARSEGKFGGAWLFKGTRVPVRALFENIESGARVDDFLKWFPGVEQAIRNGGGHGSIIGRNSFQRKKADALKMLDTIMSIYEGKIR
jgi:hypothetical protein